MSKYCPLCGNNKSEEELFCHDCKSKIQNDYEVELPSKRESGGDGFADKSSDIKSLMVEGVCEEQHSATQESNRMLNAKSGTTERNGEEQYESIQDGNTRYNTEYKTKRKKKGSLTIWIISVLLISTALYFIYEEVVKKGNLERSTWELALKENSKSSYLSYMDQYPRGVYFEEAENKLIIFKQEEDSIWESLKNSDNSGELDAFLTNYPESAYLPLVRSRLDSIMWIAALKTNTAESYSEYLLMSESGKFDGDYFTPAQNRYNMLFQSYPVDESDLSKIQETISGFYSALSTVSYDKITKYLAPTVTRFFNARTASRDKISGELVMASAKSTNNTIKFEPDIKGLQYERDVNDSYKANVSLVKEMTNKQGINESISGYIVHVSLDSIFQITSISETKPYTEAP